MRFRIMPSSPKSLGSLCRWEPSPLGAVVTETVFSYPGIGRLIVEAIQNQDYFLIQGCFLFIIIGVLLANLIVDIAYLVVDPRTRRGMIGEI